MPLAPDPAAGSIAGTGTGAGTGADALRLRPGRGVVALVVAVAVALSLTHVYRTAADLSDWTPWIAAASVHSCLAVLVIGLLARRGQLELLRPLGAYEAAPPWLKARPLLLYAPAVVVTVGAAAIAFASRAAAGGGDAAHLSEPAAVPWAWVLWIPLVEELVFRGGISPTLRRIAGPVWGAWFAAAAFSLAHAGGALALPLGPFLLGLACEALLVLGGRLWPAVLLHAACNGTVMVFGALDPRWLEWLGFLYGRG